MKIAFGGLIQKKNISWAKVEVLTSKQNAPKQTARGVQSDKTRDAGPSDHVSSFLGLRGELGFLAKVGCPFSDVKVIQTFGGLNETSTKA